MIQSAANHSPRSSSLLNRELTGNFGVFGSKMLLARSKRAGSTKGFPQIPYSTEQGILNLEQGIFSTEQGILGEEQELYRSRIFAVERSSSRRKKSALSANGVVGEGLIAQQNDCPPSPLRWRTRMRASSAHALRVTIGQQSLRTPATKQPDQTLLLQEHVSALGVAEAVLSVMGNRSAPALSKPSSAWA